MWCDDEPVALKPKQFDLLFYFVENAGHLIKKSDLLNAVWADAYIEEATLARNVSWLRKLLEDCTDGAQIIETVPKLGYRFTAKVTRPQMDADTLIIEEQTLHYVHGEETITIDDAGAAFAEENKTNNETWEQPTPLPQNVPSPRRSSTALTFLLIGLTSVALIASGYLWYRNYAQPEEQNTKANVSERVTANNVNVADKTPVKVGSIVHLRNQNSAEAGYLDAWGLVKNKPEFSIVPTEIMFVSTHPNHNRDNGSGSWELVSATGQKDGAPLVYGDKIHLRNMYPEAGYLDNCGWLKDMPVFKKFNKIEKFAVFTAYSEDRDNGTGTWIISSDTKFDGDPVLAGDGIALENGFLGGGFLNTAGQVRDIPAFHDYDGSRLVFIHQSTINRRPRSGIWIILHAP